MRSLNSFPVRELLNQNIFGALHSPNESIILSEYLAKTMRQSIGISTETNEYLNDFVAERTRQDIPCSVVLAKITDLAWVKDNGLLCPRISLELAATVSHFGTSKATKFHWLADNIPGLSLPHTIQPKPDQEAKDRLKLILENMESDIVSSWTVQDAMERLTNYYLNDVGSFTRLEEVTQNIAFDRISFDGLDAVRMSFNCKDYPLRASIREDGTHGQAYLNKDGRFVLNTTKGDGVSPHKCLMLLQHPGLFRSIRAPRRDASPASKSGPKQKPSKPMTREQVKHASALDNAVTFHSDDLNCMIQLGFKRMEFIDARWDSARVLHMDGDKSGLVQLLVDMNDGIYKQIRSGIIEQVSKLK